MESKAWVSKVKTKLALKEAGPSGMAVEVASLPLMQF